MKKAKYFVLTAALASMLVGAGYASWTDQLNINNEVKTGHLDMHFVDRGEAAELQLPNLVTGDVSYAQDTEENGQNNWDVANVKLGNLYPGARTTVSLKMQNNSTIPVEMMAIKDTRSENWGPNGENFEQIGACVEYYDKDGNKLTFANTTSYANPWEPEHLKDIALPVGGYAIISFTFTASDTIDEEATYEFKPYALFKQLNAEFDQNWTQTELRVVKPGDTALGSDVLE